MKKNNIPRDNRPILNLFNKKMKTTATTKWWAKFFAVTTKTFPQVLKTSAVSNSHLKNLKFSPSQFWPKLPKDSVPLLPKIFSTKNVLFNTFPGRKSTEHPQKIRRMTKPQSKKPPILL